MPPCPHERLCELTQTRNSCTVPQKFKHPDFANAPRGEVATARFSYLILEKPQAGDTGVQKSTWPRVVSNPKVNLNCVSCNMCSQDGSVRNYTVVKGKDVGIVYTTLLKTTKGDLLPLTDESAAVGFTGEG